MIFEIPLDDTKAVDDFSVNVELDGNTYVLSFSYSANTDRWYMDCAIARTATDPEPIVSGVCLAAGYPMLAGVTHIDRPAGELVCESQIDPGRNDLGTLARLRYFDAAEFAE